MTMNKLLSAILLLTCFVSASSIAQEIPIASSSIDASGRIQIKVPSTADHYYMLNCHRDGQPGDEWPVSMTLGTADTTILTESLAALPETRYRVVQYVRNQPADEDGDAIDDIEEFEDMGRFGPLNRSSEVPFIDGVVCIPDHAMFEALSYQGLDVVIDRHLEDLEFVKFYILDAHTDNPKMYFMNTVSHRSHRSFARAVGIPTGGPGGGGSTLGQMRGEIIYHPYVTSPNGTPGVYRFEFEPNDSYSFAKVEMAYELMAANMPLLRNNLAYYPMPNAALPRYNQEKALYDASRIAIILEEDIFANVGYQPLNMTEGYGLLRLMTLEERPNSRDIVIFEALPNELSRVAGIITTVPQTPLSHVNLRAIQDKVPNAYIAGALEIDSISALIGKYVYYRVDAEGYFIREATLAEVEAHYDDLRPDLPQIPTRDLSKTLITPLDQISFGEWTGFGVKCANVATMRTFGFPDGTIPDGFGVPFYFYDEFMKFNGFYDSVQVMLADPDFQTEYNVQDDVLSQFRRTIKDADMPQWMLDQLAVMHASFPEGSSVRCRSSTNNEDLPGFSGAGLYDSKTQHPDEGHISKSIKQVFASLWNFRAFDERQFYRIDHLATAMGVLVHPNYSDEKANGVGVTTDPIYETDDTYYLNTQIGEDLVTNPEALSIPEEILLNTTSGYSIVRRSNQIPDNQQIMSVQYLDLIRGYLTKIHNEFEMLYGATGVEGFAMEIEYKITSDDRLAIKQARPWVTFNPMSTAIGDDIPLLPSTLVLKQNFPNPFNPSTQIDFSLGSAATVRLTIFNALGQEVTTLINGHRSAGNHSVVWDGSSAEGQQMSSGVYYYQLVSQRGSEKLMEVKQMELLK
jgi:pyruvate phosphate dikinase-like enzyme/flagellar hook capping protein FlgD